ncbi:SKA1-like protein [Mya arenaria]|uniref:SKA complex subunit 1 n=1 Tax=Mya arenaria TaxID=6604 RepID=A0ABY7DVZ6_MYAAR|nr:SKA1-like protein [Mya arenaria]
MTAACTVDWSLFTGRCHSIDRSLIIITIIISITFTIVKVIFIILQFVLQVCLILIIFSFLLLLLCFPTLLCLINLCLILFKCSMDSASLSDLRGFFESKLQVVQTLLELRDFSEDDTCTQEMQGVNEDLVDLKARLAYMTDNIPDRLPRPTQSRKAESPAIQRTALKLVTNQINTSGSVGNQMKTNISSSKSAHCKQVNVYLPEIDFLTVEEFENCYFIVDEDIKLHGKMKIDKTAQSTLAILRHCGRVREVRGGRLARYVYIDRY